MKASAIRFLESMAGLGAMAVLLAAAGCARDSDSPQKAGSVPSPPELSCSITPPSMALADFKLEGDRLRYSNALYESPRAAPEAAVSFPAGRIKVNAIFRHACVSARAGEAVRYDRHETPLSLVFIAQPKSNYILEVLGDGIPLDPTRTLAPGEPAEVDGHTNLGDGPCPRAIRLGVKGPQNERIIIIDSTKPASAPPAAKPATSPARPAPRPAMRRVR